MADEADSHLRWHYTSAAGLLGILESQTLFATDARFLNDEKEIEYARPHVLEMLIEEEGLASASGNARRARGLRQCIEHIDAELPKSRVYTVCFCEKGNLLSQWRSYGANQGYALGFDLTRARTQEPYNYQCVKVFYGVDEAKVFLRNEIEAFPANDASSHSWADMASHLFQRIIPSMAFVKVKAFEEEQEWRIVLSPNGDGLGAWAPLKMRTAPIGLVPYIELPISWRGAPDGVRSGFGGSDSDGPGIPLVAVRVGPGQNSPLRAEAVRILLRKMGYAEGEVQVTESDIPLRP
jgi:hypothetical protein